jgi:MoaA/NifB/PqqE/SkfB family radical SAM enzyme
MALNTELISRGLSSATGRQATVKAFDRIYFEISGVCNGKCPYCLSGLHKRPGGMFIESERFEKALDFISENHLLAKDGTIGLYNWGEPFLHPRLSELIHMLNEHDLAYGFSTNASRVPAMDKHFVKNLRFILFSMPGFSQRAYDRIHGFQFEAILQNIKSIVRRCRDQGFHGSFTVVYHVYQFNLDDIFRCEQFAAEWDIRFSPSYAILNNWWHINALIDNALDYGLLRRISEDLFSFDFREKISATPTGYSCPQYEWLALDEACNLLLCCQVPPGEEFSCGNLLNNDITTMLHHRQNNPICKECIRKGLSYYFHHSLRVPGFYLEAVKTRYSNKFIQTLARLEGIIRRKARSLRHAGPMRPC